MNIINNWLCRLFGHYYEKIPITLDNYENYITICKRCNKRIKLRISKVTPPFNWLGKGVVEWITHGETALV